MITQELERIERATLGALLCNARSRSETATLEIGDFALDGHRQLLTVIRQMDEQGSNVDSLTLFDELRRRKLTDAVGGAGYVAHLTEDRGFLSGELGEYVRIIKRESARRKLIALCDTTRSRAENGDDPEEIYGSLQTSALEAQAASVQVRAAHISGLVLPSRNEIERHREHKGDVLGIPTGLKSFDQATTGWRDGELTYIGASPGSGKTSFMMQAMYFAASNGFGVGFISLEMRGGQLMRRLLAIDPDSRPTRLVTRDS